MKKYIFCLRNDLLSMFLYTFLIGLAMYLCKELASLFILKNLSPSCKNKMGSNFLYSNYWFFAFPYLTYDFGQIIVFAKQAQKINQVILLLCKSYFL